MYCKKKGKKARTLGDGIRRDGKYSKEEDDDEWVDIHVQR